MNFLRAISNILRFDRTNWKALALCFFAAAVFWIFNALNKNYATNLKLPLQFEYDNARYTAVEAPPATLTVNVNGNGWELFRKSLGVKVPIINMPLERPLEMRKIAAASLAPTVASQVGGLQLNYIVTDTLRMKFEPKVQRTLKLMADLTPITFKKGLGRTSAVVLLPDSVTVEGPKSAVDELPDTLLVRVNATRVSGNFRESAEINVGESSSIKRDPPVVDIMFEVGPMEEISRKVKVKTPKVPWGMEVINDSITCVFILPEREHQNFISSIAALEAALIDPFTDLKKGETKSFQPLIKGVPAFATLTRADSVKVKRY